MDIYLKIQTCTLVYIFIYTIYNKTFEPYIKTDIYMDLVERDLSRSSNLFFLRRGWACVTP